MNPVPPAAVRRLVLAATFVLLPARSLAISAGEIRNQARQVGGASGDAAAEQRRVEQLGPLVLQFIDLCDDAARAGTEAQRRDELRGAFEAIYGPLNGIYAARSGRLESLARGVMDQDGDLEGLYETPEFRQSQAIAALSLYYLNWLDYYGARLYDGARRTELLEAAEKGFSEFAVGDHKGELITESLLGRGLSHLELADYDFALRDFKLVMDDPNVSAERKAKARLAMLDAYARAGRLQEALRYSDEILGGGSVAPGDVPLIKFYRLTVLFDAQEKSKGAEAERYRRDASLLMDQLRRAGKGWADKVDALMVSRIKDPSQWAGKAESPRVQWELARLMLQKNDYDGAAPLLEDVLASADPEVKQFQAEAHYWLGVVEFKKNDFAGAAAQFDAALAAPAAEWAGEARYLRFKALEAMMAQPADTALPGRYAASIGDLLTNNPDHPLAYEARYRLGEYEQASGRFSEAIEEYAKVHGDAAIELRASFGTLQSRFELLKTDADPKARDVRLQAIGQDLDRVNAQLKEGKAKQKGGDAALQELQAKTTLLEAVYLSLRGDAGDAKVAVLLADFGTRFPDQQDLLPQAVRLRLGALLPLGQFVDAEQAVRQYGPALARENRTDAIEGLASSYAKAGARHKAQGDAAAGASAARVALDLYGLLDGSGGATDSKRQLAVARLYETAGDWEAAEKTYRALLDADGNSLIALRGLANAEEARGKTADALAHWVQYTEKSRGGDTGWYQGQYQQARLLVASGDKARACDLLTELRPAMPGLTDADLKRELDTVYREACK